MIDRVQLIARSPGRSVEDRPRYDMALALKWRDDIKLNAEQRCNREWTELGNSARDGKNNSGILLCIRLSSKHFKRISHYVEIYNMKFTELKCTVQ